MITNLTKNITLSSSEIHASSWPTQLRGLMFSPRRACLMHFSSPRRISLHNFFVFYTLDILLLDHDLRIVEIKRNFRPFTIWTSALPGLYCLELPSLITPRSSVDSLIPISSEKHFSSEKLYSLGDKLSLTL